MYLPTELEAEDFLYTPEENILLDELKSILLEANEELIMPGQELDKDNK